MRLKNYLLFCFLIFNLSVKSQLTIKISQVPSYTEPNATLYLAGNFNNWNPSSNVHKFKKIDSIYTLTFNPGIQFLEFKITRGSWNTVEGNSEGKYIPNRTYKYTKEEEINLIINGWEDFKTPSTASPNVSIETDSFYMKTLQRYRRIWIYLPPDYKTSNKNYNVVYMHDGQNLFDTKTSFNGEWKVDETCDELFKKGIEVPIIIGIDNGGNKRIAEYSPWKNAQYGGGEGDKYLEFIVNELKPYIDGKYRTKKSAQHTALIGSSLGGLISLYGGVKYSNYFTKIGSLSSAFWFAPDIYNYTQLNLNPGLKIYMIAGGKEGGTQVEDMYKMQDIILSKNYSKGVDVLCLDHPTEGHNEQYWSKEFGTIIQWLFTEQVDIDEHNIKHNIKVNHDSIYYEVEGEFTIIIYDVLGRKIIEGKNSINKKLLPKDDNYIVKIVDSKEKLVENKIIFISK